MFCFGISTLPIASFRTMLSSLPLWIKKHWRSYPGLQIPRHVHVTFHVEESKKLVFILIFITVSEAYLRAKTTFKIWHFYSAKNFNRNCLETACINTLQFLFQIFTLFNPIFNILGTCKLNCISYLFKFCYRHILRSNESWTWSNNSVWIWKLIVNKTDYAKAALRRRFSK